MSIWIGASLPAILYTEVSQLSHSFLPAPAAAALAFLVALAVAETMTIWLSPTLGLLVHLLLFFLLLLRAARPDHQLLLSLALAPLIRIISLSLPLASFSRVYWYLLTSIPLFAATLVVMRLLRLPWRLAGLDLKGYPLQLLIGLTGIGLGVIQYKILKPPPLLNISDWTQFLFASVNLLVCTGYLEELIFRRLMQRSAVIILGDFWGILYVAVLSTVLHLGYRSALDLAYVFILALAFGTIVARTGTILGVTLAHGLINIMFYLVMPL